MSTVTIKNSTVDPRSACGESLASLGELANKVREAHAQVRGSFESCLQHVLTAGRALVEAKSLVRHGEWSAWLELNCELPKRTAQLYMRLARTLPPLLEGDPQHVADLSLRGAIAHLRKPKAQGIDNDESQRVVRSEPERLKKIDALSEKLGQLMSPGGLFICIDTPTDPAAAELVRQCIATSERSGYTVCVRGGGRIVTISKACADAALSSTVTVTPMADQESLINLD